MKSLIFEQLSSLKLLDQKGYVLDLGCGDGKDTFAFANAGFSVHAVDIKSDSINRIEAKKEKLLITTLNEDIFSFEIKENFYSVIIAKNSLSFVTPKERVIGLIKQMTLGLKNNGVLYITLFGPNDQWAQERADQMSFFEFNEVEELLHELGLKHIHRSTEEGLGPKMDGSIKYWHIHKFLYQKHSQYQL